MNLKSLYLMTNDKKRILEFLMERKCQCGSFQEISKGGKTDMNYRIRCPRPCRKETSLLKNTFLRILN